MSTLSATHFPSTTLFRSSAPDAVRAAHTIGFRFRQARVRVSRNAFRISHALRLPISRLPEIRAVKGIAHAALRESRGRAGGVTQDRCPDRPNAPDRIKPQMTRLRLPTSSERDLRDYRLQTIVRIGAEGQLRIDRKSTRLNSSH